MWLPVTCNLSSATYRGQTVFFRFYFWSTDTTQYQGIYIDNIRLCDGTPTLVGCTEGSCSSAGTCTQGTCTTTIFSDSIESGIGSWINLTVDYPESFGSAFVSVYAEEQTPEYDTYVLTSTGKLAESSLTAKAKAKISVHGESTPYTVKTHSWKRYF